MHQPAPPWTTLHRHHSHTCFSRHYLASDRRSFPPRPYTSSWLRSHRPKGAASVLKRATRRPNLAGSSEPRAGQPLAAAHTWTAAASKGRPPARGQLLFSVVDLVRAAVALCLWCLLVFPLRAFVLTTQAALLCQGQRVVERLLSLQRLLSLERFSRSR